MAGQTIDDPGRVDSEDTLLEKILGVVRRYWGYTSLRPHQAEAIRAGLDRRDSLVVLPTGGGKSLCYQVPPLLAERTDIVVSPLISLMKDQVDGLQACGYPAAALHSGLSPDERHKILNEVVAGQHRLVFVAPERLMTNGFLSVLSRLDVRSFAIDEAHCISHWGHDFRPEYRQLSQLKQEFPQASIHAYTATATERVRRDIIEQLGLDDAALLVGTFDRPNLAYRVVARVDVNQQVLDVIRRHRDEAVIVYCISRKDTETLAEFLISRKVKAAHYHAGMNADERRQTQEAFTNEELDVIVATVAFGMGIDRSNVRCVIHAAMPKSIEHYQQETGRAGRDGLEAECVLFYSFSDFARWKSLLTKSHEEAGAQADSLDAQLELLEHLRRYCQPFHCRHKHLSEYFGQPYEKTNCRACDVCLNETPDMEDATVPAQMILSCVARTEERFGVNHIVNVLRGGDTEMVRKWSHQNLSTYGLMRNTSRKSLTHMVNQLCDQSLLERTSDEYKTLRLNGASWQVMRGERKVRMLNLPEKPTRQSGEETSSWIGVDRELFEELRSMRTQLARERGVPPYLVFNDATLRDMARRKPRTERAMLTIHGVGEQKLKNFGRRFVDHIDSFCRSHEGDQVDGSTPSAPSRKIPPAAFKAFEMFADGASIEAVTEALGRAASTVYGYLADHITTNKPDNIRPWVDDETYTKVADSVRQFGTRRLKPIFEFLDGQVPYEKIRLVTAHLNIAENEASD